MSESKMRHWLKRLISDFGQTAREVRSLRSETTNLRSQKELLQSQIAKQRKINEDRQQAVKRRDDIIEELKGRLVRKDEVIEKLQKNLDAIQLEKKELYTQYSRLLSDFFAPQDVTLTAPGIGSAKKDKSEPKNEGSRLNMGCGRVKKVGYLNMDVDPSVKPDVVFSLDQPLPFESNVFELIEAYHVIEHVYPWATLDTLKELRRILRPEGKLAIECPNIEFACSSLVRSAEYGWNSQMGMWALYGDPNPRNPLQMHKWGYTPLTLWQILQAAGFVGIQREAPEAHVPARDFRIVARKPPH
jgi:hypothetical protein